MTKLIKKTILGVEIRSFQFYKMKVARLYKELIFGWINLEDGQRIKVEYGKYFIINKQGQKSGIILKSNPSYKKVKRLIARWFTTYRNGNKGGQCNRAGYWRSRAVDGLHNCNLFRHSNISFKENPSNFLKLAA